MRQRLRQQGRFSMAQRYHSEGLAPKNLILIALIFTITIIPNIALAYPKTSNIMEYKNLNKNITREELATMGVRIAGLEDLIEYEWKEDFKDAKGWSMSYINVANTYGIMQGVGNNQFKPKAKVKYIELLTVIMRSIGYKDGVDFQKYPEDYYNKALEIGLADLYISYNEIITRQIAWDTLEKLQNITEEDEKEIAIDENPTDYNDTSKVDIKNIKFSTSIVGVFSGELIGPSDFSGYRVELFSDSGKLYEKKTLGKSGDFSITGFDVDFVAKLDGYKYRVYDNRGNLVLRGEL